MSRPRPRGRAVSPGRRLARHSWLGAAVIGMAACSSPPPGVSNGSVSACYRAIPVGRAAVNNGNAKLIGVHRIALDTVRNRLSIPAGDQLSADNDSSVCALSFHGDFMAGQVHSAPSDEQGPYAVVLVSTRDIHLVGAVVLDRLPASLGARTL